MSDRVTYDPREPRRADWTIWPRVEIRAVAATGEPTRLQFRFIESPDPWQTIAPGDEGFEDLMEQAGLRPVLA